MITTNTISKLLLASTFCLGFIAEAGSVRGTSPIHYVNPTQYNFTISPYSNEQTDCGTLARLLKNYANYHCDSTQPSGMCQTTLAQIKVEQELDRQDSNPLNDFGRLYIVGSTGNVAAPQTYSKRFDMSYADSFDFSLSALSTPGVFRFDGKMSPAELSAEAALGSSKGFTMVTVQGQKYLQLKSKIRVCALESGRISLVGSANMNISGYHPVGRVAYEIVEQTYRKGAEIAARSDINESQKNYLLGLAAGDALKKMADLITDEKELNDVALSLQTVMLNANADHFDLVPADMSTSFGIALLEPGYVVQSAPIQITYKAQ